MIRSFKYRLHPNKHQESTLNSWLLNCGVIWNWGLEQRKYAYEIDHRSITKYEQYHELTALNQYDRELDEEDRVWSRIPAQVLRSSLNKLDKAFSAFFRRVRLGETAGYPRFKRRNSHKSFTYAYINSSKSISSQVHVPKLGHVKFNLYRPIEGKIKTVTIKRSASNKWWVSFACDVGAAPQALDVNTIPEDRKIGIDLGLTHLFTDSDGNHIKNKRHFKKSQAKLKRLQQNLSRKSKGSKSRERARVAVAKLHEHIHNQRLDGARQLVAKLFNKYDLVAYEDLNVKGLINKDNSKLAKSIHDASWSIFIQCLINKAENAGKLAVKVDPRGTSQNCSGCGAKVPKTLRDRVHDCPECGLKLDRDHNAAINVKKRARSAPSINSSLELRSEVLT